MMHLLEKAVEKATEHLVDYGLKTGKSCIDLDANMQSLERKWQALSSRATDIEEELQKAESSGKKKRKREVNNWLKEVKKIEAEFPTLQKRVQGERNPSSVENVEKIHKMVHELIEQSHNFNDLLLDGDANKGQPRLTTKLFGENVKQNLERIWQCLVMDQVSVIGIYGMGGVGKTTLAKHIHNHLLDKTDFDVYWITVSQDLSIKSLQNEIAKVAGVHLLDEDDEEIRAAMLSKKLTEMENFILIFDDLWDNFCLKRVGNPLGAKGCRLILTTRSFEICRKMVCQRVFEVTTLDTDEAWELFEFTLGNETLLSAEVRDIAKSLAMRCAGLPLGINTVAGSMRGVEDIHEWRNALKQLQASSMGNDDMENKVFPVLEWSFTRLNKCHQLCFLYCSLYPEDFLFNREELIYGFIWAGLLDKRNTRQQDFDQAHSILNKLINVCLLEDPNRDQIEPGKRNFVRMHDLIRDMALRITSGDSRSKISGDMPRFMVKAGNGLGETLKEEWAEDLDVVSFMHNHSMSGIPPGTSPNCPNLSILILRGTSLQLIPNSFLLHMIRLKVLDLSFTKIQELPDCVTHMEHLTILLLHWCENLTYVPPLGKLKQLMEINLDGTSIQDLPQGLEELVNLKRLYMLFTKVEMVPVGTLFRLSHLECLWVSNSIEVEDLAVLKQLEEFLGMLPNIDAYNRFVMTRQTSGRPTSYYIVVNENPDCGTLHSDLIDDDYFDGRFKYKRLVFTECSIQNGGQGEVNVVLLPQDIQELEIEFCSGKASCLSDVFPQLNCSNDLMYCSIEDSFELEYLMRLSSINGLESSCSPLYSLKKLALYDLPNFVGLIKWESGSFVRLPRGTLSNLTRLEICGCQEIQKLFSLQLLQNLKNLEEVYVSECDKMEEVMADDEMGGLESNSSRTITVVLPKLKILRLFDLPELRSIFNGIMVSDSLSEVIVKNCPKLRRLPLSLSIINGQLSCPEALNILGSDEWWESLEWDNPGAKIAFQHKFIVGQRIPGFLESLTASQFMYCS